MKKITFTLIELLVVIAIISVLASLLLPALNSAMRKAKVLSCQQTFRSLGIITYQYGDDHNSILPPFAADIWKAQELGAASTTKLDVLWGKLIPYGLTGEIATCPFGRRSKHKQTFMTWWNSRSDFFYVFVQGSYYNKNTYAPLRFTYKNPSEKGIVWDTDTDSGSQFWANNHRDDDGLNIDQSVLYLDGHTDILRRPGTAKRFGLGF